MENEFWEEFFLCALGTMKKSKKMLFSVRIYDKHCIQFIYQGDLEGRTMAILFELSMGKRKFILFLKLLTKLAHQYLSIQLALCRLKNEVDILFVFL